MENFLNRNDGFVNVLNFLSFLLNICTQQGMVVGVGTEAIAGEGLILTAGGFDAHIHFVCPQLAEEAIASGLTTMVGGGTGTFVLWFRNV